MYYNISKILSTELGNFFSFFDNNSLSLELKDLKYLKLITTQRSKNMGNYINNSELDSARDFLH